MSEKEIPLRRFDIYNVNLEVGNLYIMATRFNEAEGFIYFINDNLEPGRRYCGAFSLLSWGVREHPEK